MIANLRRKFILVAMLSTLAVLAAIMGTVNISNYLKMVQRADNMTALLVHDKITSENMESTALPQKDENAKPDDKPGKERGRDDGISEETPYDTRYFTVVLDENGDSVSANLDKIAAVDEEEAVEYAEEAAASGKTEGFLGIYRYRVSENEDGSEITYTFLDCRKEISNVRSVLITTLSVSALGLAAVLALVMFFSRLVFKPVEESLQKQKRFITDASHELKTPLTIIDANTEVTEMDSGETQWTKSTRKQVQRLSALVQQMVTLTRLDEGRDSEDKAEFDLSEAVEESVQPYEAPAQVTGKKLNTSLEENITYVGNERSIRQLVGILTDNAVKYTPEGGEIHITLKRKGKKIFLEVSNDALEMPTGNLEVLFERFYRLDSSRNSGTGGSGIGLSIAQAVVKAHKGKITAESTDGKSLTVKVTL